DLAVRKRELLESFLDPPIEHDVTAWERSRTDGPAVWRILDAESAVSKEGSTLVKQPDGSILSTGARPATDTYTITARSPLRRVAAVRIEVLTVADHPYKGPGRQDNGNFHLSEFRPDVGGNPLALQPPS